MVEGLLLACADERKRRASAGRSFVNADRNMAIGEEAMRVAMLLAVGMN